MFSEDNNGFVFFPFGNRMNINSGEKTIIYLVAFDTQKKTKDLSNLNISLPGDFVSDDVVDRINSNDVILNDKLQNDYNNIYFPNLNSVDVNRMISIPLVSCICIGWSNDSFEYKAGNTWKASYRDLTEEGKKLYYSIKKLHNSKEVRILTFNNI